MPKNNITILDNEPYLRQVSRQVRFSDISLVGNIKDLEEYCLSKKIFALSSVQIGIPKRIIYIKSTDPESYLKNEEVNEARILINPVIINRKGLTKYWEACESCMDYMGLVSRPYQIIVRYQDENNKRHTRTYKGFEATVLSHEYDHLNGVLHIDIAEQILNMPHEERVEFRKTHKYKIISKDCDFEEVLVKKRHK